MDLQEKVVLEKPAGLRDVLEHGLIGTLAAADVKLIPFLFEAKPLERTVQGPVGEPSSSGGITADD